MRILSVLGNRPQFIKSSMLSRALAEVGSIEEILVHTGQHYDHNMSDVFFQELGLKEPDHKLHLKSNSHASMTGDMMMGLENVMKDELPELVLVYGDTNTTIAAAITAKKLNLKLAHIESGLRSGNRMMPEEINRIVTDRLADIHYCPTQGAVENLTREGHAGQRAHICLSGDVMYDAALFFSKDIELPEFSKEVLLVSIHRAENTNSPEKLKSIAEALNELSQEFEMIFPLHPRTKKYFDQYDVNLNFEPKEPLSYIEMLRYLKAADLVLTDSGGLQKEAYFFKKPCVTVREETEWLELTEAGVNALVTSNSNAIVQKVDEMRKKNHFFEGAFYGNGNASVIIAKDLLNSMQ